MRFSALMILDAIVEDRDLYADAGRESHGAFRE
jgi:hypothetical protein